VLAGPLTDEELGCCAVGIVCADAGPAASTVAIAIDTIDVRFTLSSLVK